MAEVAAIASVAGDSERRRNALILTAATAVLAGNGAVAFSLGGLAGIYLLGDDKSLATLPLTGYTVGIALGALPAAALMRKMGRRFGFLTGALVACLGGVVAGFAVIVQSFPLLIAALVAVGLAASFTQQYRFAAADGADPAFRARAISWVLGGGVAAAVIGPQTVIFTHDWLKPIPFAGGFFAMAALGLVGFAILSQLSGAARLPPPKVSHGGRPLAVLARQPRFVVAIICAMGTYSVMNLVMTAAPLAIVGCGLGETNAALGIQWHAVAMYAPSFVTGGLIARFGKERVIVAGLALLGVCGVVALAGVTLENFWGALILLGVGWNFAFIGATTMLTEIYRPEEKAKVEGFNDFLVFGSVAVASASSGKLFSSVGWHTLLLVTYPIILVCALALVTAFLVRRRAALSGVPGP